MVFDQTLAKAMYEENQRMIVLLQKAEERMVNMYNAITNGNGEAFASQDEFVKELREYMKNAV